MKIDPYQHKERYLAWKQSLNGRQIPRLSKENSDIILSYLEDMENGLNVASGSKKGSRSFIRLNTLKTRLIFLSNKFQERYGVSILELSERQLHSFFTEMKNGTITRQDGKTYQSVVDYVKIFKSLWHWHQKTNRKEGIAIRDITTDLDTSHEKPDWVYLTEEQVKKLCDSAKYEYKVLMWFLFDTGIRAPTELVNIKVSDIYNNYKELNIRDEISKTFGRKIKLMICPKILKEYVELKQLRPEDALFPVNPKSINNYLKRLAKRTLGDTKSPAGQKYSDLTMYDFRHCSCCYWLPRYKSESALKFRFGWKKSDKIHYYSEMLGMRDTISEEDLLMDLTKTEIEKRLVKSENEKEMLQERLQILEVQMQKILQMVNNSCFVVRN